MAMQQQKGMRQKVFFADSADLDKLEHYARKLSVEEDQRITSSDLLRLAIKNLIKKLEK